MKKNVEGQSKILTHNYSYWEAEQYFGTINLAVIGSGIVGLSTAISFKVKNPHAKVIVLERGFLPDGASTKNAGFACFGSAGELLSDLEKIKSDTVWQTFAMRYEGLKLLEKRLGKKKIDYQQNGGFELFDDLQKFNNCRAQIQVLNKNVKDAIGKKNCFVETDPKDFPFKGIKGIINNRLEGQLNTGLLMKHLLKLSQTLGVIVLNNVEVHSLSEDQTAVKINTNRGEFVAGKVVVAVNAFACKLLGMKDVQPARAQVLITKPIQNLKIKGTFHFDEGYYYFRNIDDRILLGGGRNENFKQEETLQNGLTPTIQNKLENYLTQMILPGKKIAIERRWSGIMGIGSEKKPIIKSIGKHTVVAVRMGGMGVAIGSLVGEKAAKLIQEH